MSRLIELGFVGVLGLLCADLAVAAGATPRKGDVVVVQRGAGYVQAEVLEVQADGDLKIKEQGSRFERRITAKSILTPDEGHVLATADSPIKVGDKLQARWNAKWTNVEVREVADDKVKVHWEGYADNFDSYVGKFALQLPTGVKAGGQSSGGRSLGQPGRQSHLDRQQRQIQN